MKIRSAEMRHVRLPVEEPIVNAPAECARALIDGRIDFVVTEQAVYSR